MPAVFVNMITVILGSAIGILFRSKIKESSTKTIITVLEYNNNSINLQNQTTPLR